MADLAAQAGKLLGPLSGTATIWSLELGLRLGLFGHLAARQEGATSDEVAAELGLDPLYTKVVLRAAYAAEVLENEAGRYRLADHMETLLLDPDAPTYLGGAIRTFVAMRESWLDLREFAKTGQTEWWADFDPEWIHAVAENGQTYYRRLLDSVVPRLPAVHDKLKAGARYLDLACGVCQGPAKIAKAFPETRVTAVDCDRYSLTAAEREMQAQGLGDRFRYVESFLETMRIDGGHDLAIINISLHEARDLETAVERVRDALDPGGVFLVSEFPFPDDESETRSVPGRLMCGVQLFEAHIGCQLLPASRFVGLLRDAGFSDVGTIDVTPMQVVIHGTK